MKDTIELLETIGKDASLRYADKRHLTEKLDNLGANETLKMAAITGDSEYLRRELGSKWLNSSNHPANTNITVPEVPEEEEEEEEEEKETEPDKK